MPATLKFKFSPEEVNLRLVLDVVTQAPELLKRHAPPVEGKTYYTTLLCDKISAVLPTSVPYSVDEGFRDAAKGLSKCYVKCDHDKKSPVTFKKTELQEDQELTFTIEVKCALCLSHEPPTAPSIASQASIPVVEQQLPRPHDVLPPISVDNPNPVSDLFRQASVVVSESWVRAHSICLSSTNPERAFAQNRDRFGQMFLAAYNAATQDFMDNRPGSPLDLERQRSRSPSLERQRSRSPSQERTGTLAPPFLNANAVLSQAQKRIREQNIRTQPKRARKQ